MNAILVSVPVRNIYILGDYLGNVEKPYLSELYYILSSIIIDFNLTSNDVIFIIF